MKAFLSITVPLVFCLLIASCTTSSVNPLASPKVCQADPRLVGDWHGGTGSDQSTCHFTITKAPWMHVDIVPDHPDSKSKINRTPESYDFFPTVIGKNTFLNVVQRDENDHAKSYLFIRYKISGNRLRLWLMSQQLPAAAIRAGKLKGLVSPDGVDIAQKPAPDIDVTLNDSSENIVKFIQASNLDRLFDTPMTPFYRVKPAGK